MMRLRGKLCSEQSRAERIKRTPSVSSCLHLEQLRAEDVMSEPRQAASRELLVAFHLFVLYYANVVPASLPALQTEANIQLY